MHRYMVGIADCYVFIENNKNHLTNQCQISLKLFDPTRGDISVCDGRLLHNIADKYSFVVRLYNYTKTWCAGGLHPMLIYFNITQIIKCERKIREGLKKSPEACIAYDSISSDLLHIYVHNINNYRDCDEQDGEVNSSTTIIHIADNCP
ncbi:unnamed protein product [Adineta steineri]|uniref:Uncharacterized protein n=1 Tax=Adineta steineri TaxID=433720 RepID=A0A814I2X8_9BILA|nr:unnamed protein product [Adineta steineri]CAF3994314.1 unnamed protein product [Adineta steineri]